MAKLESLPRVPASITDGSRPAGPGGSFAATGWLDRFGDITVLWESPCGRLHSPTIPMKWTCLTPAAGRQPDIPWDR